MGSQAEPEKTMAVESRDNSRMETSSFLRAHCLVVCIMHTGTQSTYRKCKLGPSVDSRIRPFNKYMLRPYLCSRSQRAGVITQVSFPQSSVEGHYQKALIPWHFPDADRGREKCSGHSERSKALSASDIGELQSFDHCTPRDWNLPGN